MVISSLVGLLKCSGMVCPPNLATQMTMISVTQGGLGRSWELKLYLTLIQDGSFIQNGFSLVPFTGI